MVVRYKIDKKSLKIGAQHEMEHTKDKKQAEQIAADHLREHPTYYKVLPYAEKIMTRDERNIRPIHKKKKKPPMDIMRMQYNF